MISYFDYEYFSKLDQKYSFIYFHRSICNDLTLLTWIYQIIQLERSVVIYGESFIFEPILKLCQQCIDGHAHFTEEKDVDRKIYQCEVNERFVMMF